MENKAPKIDSEQLEKDIYSIAGKIWEVENMKINLNIGEAIQNLKQSLKNEILE